MLRARSTVNNIVQKTLFCSVDGGWNGRQGGKWKQAKRSIKIATEGLSDK